MTDPDDKTSDETSEKPPEPVSRREFVRGVLRYAALGGLVLGSGALLGWPRGRRPDFECLTGAACPTCPSASTCPLGGRVSAQNTVWQIDPDKCIQCGNCATACVLKPSAVKCIHEPTVCGYCQPCFGFFDPQSPDPTVAAEGQLCPTDAIRRRLVTPPYYEYSIIEERCNACGKCVKGCNTHGNGALYLQVRHDRCLNCSECAIARSCPSGAYVRVPANRPYIRRPKSSSSSSSSSSSNQ